jgi:hypothetical protein
MLAASRRGDIVIVPVIYRVVGSIYDQSEGGTRRYQFTPNLSMDTTWFLVVKRHGRLAIACPTYLSSDRIGLSRLGDMVRLFDDSSASRWRAALKNAAHPE